MLTWKKRIKSSAIKSAHSFHALIPCTTTNKERPQWDSNPRYRRERAVSWTGLDDGDQLRLIKIPKSKFADELDYTQRAPLVKRSETELPLRI